MTDETTPETGAAQDNSADETSSVVDKSRRKPLIIGVLVAVACLALLVFLYQEFIASRSVTTDNAYVAADTAQVTPLTGGQVSQVLVKDTQAVEKGDVLVRLDDKDQRLAYEEAKAAFEYAQRRYSQSLAQSSAASSSASAVGAAVPQAQAALNAARSQLSKAQTDYRRRAALEGSGAVSGEELTQARTALEDARSGVRQAEAGVAKARADAASAREQAAATRSMIEGTTAQNAPEVLAAKSRMLQARLDLERTVIRAPVSGVIAQRNVQVGQRIDSGRTVMMIVPVKSLYVNANFKETQLGRVRAGQPATVTSDYYGDDVVFHGKVVGLSGGTGSAFSLIPAQNATGNWIKVVQRLPVRIQLDPKELAEHPLRVGLSMEAEIDLTGTPD